ncbi:hypothetical protein [Owenweeksia hongkongensis]|nr:hypothetical protein [Owenweeksia hongkongensis]
MKTTLQISMLLLVLSFSFTSCKDDENCTEEFKRITVAVKNLDGTAAQLNEVYWIDLATSDTTILAPTTSGVYILADDNTAISGTATFRFDAYQTTSQGSFLVASENYVLNEGDCHIEKTSGKSTITLD